MGKLISDATTAATCEHSQTGSTKVFVQGKGVCRVGVDTAGDKISGPGSDKVFCEGSNVSLEGDNIANHGKKPHDDPKTNVTQDKVYASSPIS